MQESRLFRIVYYLIEKGKSTAPELAQKFEVSARTIYRDIDVISSAGIPIYAKMCIRDRLKLVQGLLSSILSGDKNIQILNLVGMRPSVMTGIEVSGQQIAIIASGKHAGGLTGLSLIHI